MLKVHVIMWFVWVILLGRLISDFWQLSLIERENEEWKWCKTDLLEGDSICGFCKKEVGISVEKIVNCFIMVN